MKEIEHLINFPQAAAQQKPLRQNIQFVEMQMGTGIKVFRGMESAHRSVIQESMKLSGGSAGV